MNKTTTNSIWLNWIWAKTTKVVSRSRCSGSCLASSVFNAIDLCAMKLAEEMVDTSSKRARPLAKFVDTSSCLVSERRRVWPRLGSRRIKMRVSGFGMSRYFGHVCWCERTEPNWIMFGNRKEVLEAWGAITVSRVQKTQVLRRRDIWTCVCVWIV